jgi:hypothetical protein
MLYAQDIHKGTAMAKSFRIVNLRASNFKKIKAIDITPTEDVVRITGPNGSGKTSVLDSIWAALGGTKARPSKPIRDGADQAVIDIDCGEYRILRLFTKDEKQPPIIVRPKDGGASGLPGRPIRSPQDLLDKLVGDLSFDPLAFSRMAPKSQYEELRRVANLGPEIDQLDALNQVDYEARTRLNRMAKEAQVEAEAIDVPDDLPGDRLNVAELAESMEKAIAHNESIERRRLGRATHAERLKDLRIRAAKVRSDLDGELQVIRARADARVAELEKEIESVKREADAALALAAARSKSEVAVLTASADDIQTKLDTADPLPAPIDILQFKDAIANAQVVNSGIDAREQRAVKLSQAKQYRKESDALTKAMEDRQLAKQQAIAAAHMPVPGLSIEDGAVTLNGIPFDQASSAEQLRVSVAIAMAANPALRILRIKDGSLLDSQSMAIVKEMAGQNDFQVWIESVDESGGIGIVLEDGSVVANHYEDGANPPAE